MTSAPRILLTTAFVLSACVSRPTPHPVADAPLVGADRDAHGCIGSAGYSWSALKQACIRIFELGTPLRNLRDMTASTVAYVIAEPRAKALELFLPERPQPIALKQSGALWRNAEGTYTIQHKDRIYTVFDAAGTALYQGLQ